MMPTTSSGRAWRWLLAGACVVAFANGLTGGFTYDDKAIVRDDPRIQSWANLPEIFTTHYFGGPLESGTAYRPVDLLSLAANYAVGGKQTFGYHLVNVGLHLSNVLMLFGLFVPVAGEAASGAGALLFALMPVHVEAVTSIVGRAEVLTVFLLLLAFRLSLRARRLRSFRSYAGAAACYFFAILTKESAVVFPGLLFLYDLAGEEGSFWRRSGSRLRKLAFYAGFGIPLAATLGIRRLILKGFLISKFAGIFELENPLVSLAPLARVGNACAILLRLVGRSIFPLYLSSDESAWQLPLLGTRMPLFWTAIAAVALLAAAGVALVPRRFAVGFGILFFLLAVFPTGNFLFVTGTIMAERLAYLPSAGLALALGALVAGDDSRFASGRARAAVLAAISVAFLARTVIRNMVWSDDAALFSNMIATSPGSAKAHYDFAYDAASRHQDKTAYRHYTRATAIYSSYYDAWAGRARMAAGLGDLKEAVFDARKSIEIFPTYENGWFNAGFQAECRGDFSAAERAYRNGLEKCPRSYPLAYHLAAFLWRRGRAHESVAAFRRASTLSPDACLPHEDLGRVFASLGNRGAAEDEWQEALADFDTDGVALSGLSRLAAGRGDLASAVTLRMRLFEVSQTREQLLLLGAVAGRDPAERRRVAGRWAAWTARFPALFSESEVRQVWAELRR